MSKEKAYPVCLKLADELSYELVDVEFAKEPTGRVLRVTIDKPGPVSAGGRSGITIDDCETYHRRMVSLVEHIDYDFLEVSSPGIDRPLKTDRDFDKAVGTRVEVHLYKPYKTTKKGQNQKLRIGELLSYTKELIVIQEDSAAKREDAAVEIDRKDIALVRPYIDINAYNNNNEQGSREE